MLEGHQNFQKVGKGKSPHFQNLSSSQEIEKLETEMIAKSVGKSYLSKLSGERRKIFSFKKPNKLSKNPSR